MKRVHPTAVVILWLMLAGAAPGRSKPASKPSVPKTPAPTLTVGKLPELKLPAAPPVTAERAAQIKALIDGLVTLDKPDFGLSATLSGRSFAPVPGQESAGVMRLTDHQIQPSEGVKGLVALGPDALPFLLDALDDQRPTKITVKPFDGAMWASSYLPLNPIGLYERSFYQPVARSPVFSEYKPGNAYQVRVGDVCFVAIGQIVGRSYQAVGYVPSGCVELHCPANDPKLCAEVRSIWQSADPRQRLLDSLRADYATRGKNVGTIKDGLDRWWDAGSRLQCEAALRLLYYFGPEAAPLIASRLDELDVRDHNVKNYFIQDDAGWRAFLRQYAANGVRVTEFVKAVGWSDEPAVQAALNRVFQRAKALDMLLATALVDRDSESVRHRLETLLAAVPTDESSPHGDGYNLLQALAQRTPTTAQAAYERFLHKASAARCVSACEALRGVRVAWDKKVLRPLLSDRRDLHYAYSGSLPGATARVCDVAAIVLSQSHPELKFDWAKETAELDQQIAVIQAQLDQE